MKKIAQLQQILAFIGKVGPWLIVAADIIQYVNKRITEQNGKATNSDVPFGTGGPA